MQIICCYVVLLYVVVVCYHGNDLLWATEAAHLILDYIYNVPTILVQKQSRLMATVALGLLQITCQTPPSLATDMKTLPLLPLLPLLLLIAVLATVLPVESVASGHIGRRIVGRADHSAPTVTEAATEAGAPRPQALQLVARQPGNLIYIVIHSANARSVCSLRMRWLLLLLSLPLGR